ncbi:MAG: Spy/CpxP family protein refolding chaperone [Iphinoe sp. HA4291-MV1]|jgi:Spy/CpxP family protein refolding chaperone|nr:Spy/CpxP family protein refolding chaperone [Iphinoe sp. HA4291-MV1]
MIALGSGIALAKPSLLSPQVVAQNPTPSPHQQRSQSGWLKDLNLTPQQMQQIKAIRNQSKNQIAQKKQAIRQAQQELQALMGSTTSQDQVRNKYNQLKTLKQQLADAQFDNTLAIREVLNAQQRQKFAEQMYKKR